MLLQEDQPIRRGPSALESIPPLPRVATELLRLLADEDAGIEEVVGLLRTDPRFSAEIVRRANSPLYSAGATIDSIERAVMRLGFDKIKSIAMTVATSSYAQAALEKSELRNCWNHNLACGVLSETLAHALKMSSDRAYMAGLMHDIGRLGLIVAHPLEYSELLLKANEVGNDKASSYVLGREREVFGIDHCEAGKLLAERWGLPPELGAIAAEHHGDAVPDNDYDLVHVVMTGCQMADVLGFHAVQPADPPAFADIRSRLPEALPADFWDAPESLTEQIEERVAALYG